MAYAHCPAGLDADAIVLIVFIVFFLSLTQGECADAIRKIRLVNC
jgi:hypothetical protein